MLVYCDHITPRVSYIFHFILHTLCGLDYELTSNEKDYREHQGVTLNYSHKHLREHDIEITPNGLLSLKNIISCQAQIEEESKKVRLYIKAEGVNASIFDPFAAAFYLISRYEEYLGFTPDAHNRFEAAASLLFKKKVLTRPLINEWAEELKQTFSNTHTQLYFRRNVFSFKLSIDVDQAFAFRYRGIVRNTTALVKNFMQFNKPFLKNQWQTMVLQKRDAFDTFDYLRACQQASGCSAIYFINAGAYSKFDKNLPVSHVHFKKVLNCIKQFAEVGLHPSYFSDNQSDKLIEEKRALEAAIDKPVTQSRQHYLKLSFPQTYRQLLQAGITEDYSMGYASHPGFRAGTCTPFQWYDLGKEVATSLMVYPITYMDGSFAEDLNLQPDEALNIIKKLTDTVRRYNGTLIPIWHNHTVNDQFAWKGWKKVFEESLHYISKQA